MKKAILIGIMAAWGWTVLGQAQQPTLVSLFDFGTSVRASGMGGAFAGLADDEQALIYNPAGLALLEGLYAHATLQSQLGQATLGGLVGALPSLGVGLQFYSVDGLVQRNDQDEEGATFGYGQLALMGAGAVRLGSFIGVPALKDLGVGLRIKFLSINTLAAGSGATFALDPSLLWDLGGMRAASLAISHLRLGLALDNLGPGIAYGSGHQESLGFGARLGASATIQDTVTVALELNLSNGLQLGGEYRLPLPGAGTLALRTGVHTGNGFTFNLGLGFLYQRLLRVDYAFSSHGQLFGSHQLAVSVAFGGIRLF